MTSGKIVPESLADWGRLGLPRPYATWSCQDSAEPLTDPIGTDSALFVAIIGTPDTGALEQTKGAPNTIYTFEPEWGTAPE